MIIQGQVKESDFVWSQYLHMRPRAAFAIVGMALLFLAVVVAAISRLPMLLISLAALVLWALYIVFAAKRGFRQYKAMSEPVTIEVREDGLFFKRQNGEGLVPWAEIIKWRKSKTLVLVYPTTYMFHLIPSHFFGTPELFQTFTQILKTRLGNAT